MGFALASESAHMHFPLRPTHPTWPRPPDSTDATGQRARALLSLLFAFLTTIFS